MSASDNRFVRDLRKDELEQAIELSLLAFASDTVFQYSLDCKSSLGDPASAHKRENLGHFFRFMFQVAWQLNGQIRVAVQRDEAGKEELVALCIWFPPSKRIDLWRVRPLFKAGIVTTVKKCGLKALLRLGVEYQEEAEASLKAGFKGVKPKQSPRTGYHLQLAATHPNHQGKGHMGFLLRDQITSHPKTVFTLEASSRKSMGVYAHLGWEITREFRVGKGKVTEAGLRPSGQEEAPGVLVWAMVKWVKPEKA
jgi:hypothetical protein